MASCSIAARWPAGALADPAYRRRQLRCVGGVALLEVVVHDHAVIALDDITSGYGTLQFCHALQPEWIKVDSEVTKGIAQDPRRRAILRFLAELAKEFSSTLIAEGIESADDLDICVEEGVGAAQGYFLARPAVQPPEASPEFRLWLDTRPETKRSA